MLLLFITCVVIVDCGLWRLHASRDTVWCMQPQSMSVADLQTFIPYLGESLRLVMRGLDGGSMVIGCLSACEWRTCVQLTCVVVPSYWATGSPENVALIHTHACMSKPFLHSSPLFLSPTTHPRTHISLKFTNIRLWHMWHYIEPRHATQQSLTHRRTARCPDHTHRRSPGKSGDVDVGLTDWLGSRLYSGIWEYCGKWATYA